MVLLSFQVLEPQNVFSRSLCFGKARKLSAPGKGVLEEAGAVPPPPPPASASSLGLVAVLPACPMGLPRRRVSKPQSAQKVPSYNIPRQRASTTDLSKDE